MLCFGFLFAGSRARRRLSRGMLFSLGLCAILTAASCGGSSSSSTTTTTTPPPGSSAAGTYSVLVTATANGITHNAKIAVIVP